MEIAMILLKQIIVMFVLLLIGMLLFRFQKISVQGSKELGSLLLYVVIPIVIIRSFCVEQTQQRITGLGWSFILSLLSLVIAMLVSYAFFQKKYPLDNFASSFSNAGFIGIPLVQAAIGSHAVFYIASYIALLNVLQWTYGLMVMTNCKDSVQCKKLLTNPIVIGTVIGLLIFFLELPIPELASTIMSSVSGLNTPIAMLITGIYLAQVPLLSMCKDIRLFGSCLLRLCVIPMMTLLVFLLFDFIDPSIRLAILIAASAPVGSNIAIFASLYDADYLYSVKTVCLSTILSIITLPPIVMLAEHLF